MGEIVLFDGVRQSRQGEAPPRAQAANDEDGLTLTDRLAIALSEIVDEPLQILTDAGSNDGRPLELRLAHFKPQLAERAVALLEEAGW